MRSFPSIGLNIPEILIPNPHINLQKWSVVACDQYTSQPAYWEEVSTLVDSEPSTYHMILPEAYLGTNKETKHKKNIQQKMQVYLKDGIFRPVGGMIYVERSIGSEVRKGLLVALDLDQYDFAPDSKSLIRATEGTIRDRLPARIEIRKDAPLEIPHILVLIDDADLSVIHPLAKFRSDFTKLYDFELMMNGGEIRGFQVDLPILERNIIKKLEELANPLVQRNKYKMPDLTHPLLYAVGDGNHSLATAKSVWEEIKKKAPAHHPARYALVEIVNIHDPAIHFEPIHRILKKMSGDLIAEIKSYFQNHCQIKEKMDFHSMRQAVGKQKKGQQIFGVMRGAECGVIEISNPVHTLTVGSLQQFLDQLISKNRGLELDYIHGDDTIRELSAESYNYGFYLPSMEKELLFESVIKDGPLPRKTFSMGEAYQKRYYLECRKVIND